MVSIIELSNKTSIDSSLYSFHTLEGGVCATNPTFFLFVRFLLDARLAEVGFVQLG